MPRGRDEEREQMSRPRDRRLPTRSFVINQCIKRSTVQYFNETVRIQGQQDLLVDSYFIYFLIFCF